MVFPKVFTLRHSFVSVQEKDHQMMYLCMWLNSTTKTLCWCQWSYQRSSLHQNTNYYFKKRQNTNCCFEGRFFFFVSVHINEFQGGYFVIIWQSLVNRNRNDFALVSSCCRNQCRSNHKTIILMSPSLGTRHPLAASGTALWYDWLQPFFSLQDFQHQLGLVAEVSSFCDKFYHWLFWFSLFFYHTTNCVTDAAMSSIALAHIWYNSFSVFSFFVREHFFSISCKVCNFFLVCLRSCYRWHFVYTSVMI